MSDIIKNSGIIAPPRAGRVAVLRNPIIERAVTLPTTLTTDATRLEWACYAHKAIFDQMIAGDAACKTDQQKHDYHMDAMARLVSVSAVMNAERAKFPALMVGDLSKGPTAWQMFKERARRLAAYRPLLETHPIFRPTPTFVEMVDPYEDFSDDAEIDPNNHLTLTNNHTWTAAAVAEYVMAYKDYGIGHFGLALHHTSVVNWTSCGADNNWGNYWALQEGMMQELTAAIVRYDTIYYWVINTTYSPTAQDQYVGTSSDLGKDVICETVRSGATGTTVTQTLSGGVSDVLTIASAGLANKLFRYQLRLNGQGTQPMTMAYVSKNLDLHEGPAPHEVVIE